MNPITATLNFIAVLLLMATGAQAQPAVKTPAHGDGHDHQHGGSDVIGSPGDPKRVDRTVKVSMTDLMRFSPASISVKQGETIRFAVRNTGQLKHEMVLGTEKELKEHYELMKRFPEMEHADPQMVTVAPGKTGEIVWRFTKAGKVDFGCLQPGHYDAGMKGMVTVSRGKASTGKDDDHTTHKH